jgi:gas vesicle protein
MNWKTKTLVIGAVVGVALGLAAAFIFIQRSEQENTTPQLTAGDGVKVGLGLLGVLRTISDLGHK